MGQFHRFAISAYWAISQAFSLKMSECDCACVLSGFGILHGYEGLVVGRYCMHCCSLTNSSACCCVAKWWQLSTHSPLTMYLIGFDRHQFSAIPHSPSHVWQVWNYTAVGHHTCYLWFLPPLRRHSSSNRLRLPSTMSPQRDVIAEWLRKHPLLPKTTTTGL